MPINPLLAVQDHLTDALQLLNAMINLGVNNTHRDVSGEEVGILLGIVQDKVQKAFDTLPLTPAS
jgi:hypothetical protein